MIDVKDKLLSIKKDIESLISSPDSIPDAAPDLIKNLDDLSVDLDLLKKTKIAFSVDKLRKSCEDDAIKKSAKTLLKKWAALEAKDKPKESSKPKSETPRELGFKITAKEPVRNKKNQLVFDDSPDFRPNLSPKEVLQRGSFGGTYFRRIYSSVTKTKYGSEVWQELPSDWLSGLNVKTQAIYSNMDLFY